ncbi:hypothetical protein MKEN_00144200 [Mycena kentingensis (nom. inval.)]|nr:hypothetical protein MKEN_00144200 [Mycena kentingensis (nom. inval.)]
MSFASFPKFGPDYREYRDKRYSDFDLRDPSAFTCYRHCAPYRAYRPEEKPPPPPPRHWCFFGQIIGVANRILLDVVDTEGTTVELGLFFTGEDGAFDSSLAQPGNTIAVLYPETTPDSGLAWAGLVRRGISPSSNEGEPRLLVRHPQFASFLSASTKRTRYLQVREFRKRHYASFSNIDVSRDSSLLAPWTINRRK